MDCTEAYTRHSVEILNHIRAKCQGSATKFSLELLSGQLVTCQAAFKQLQAVLCEPGAPVLQHPQLVGDLELALGHCRLLVQDIDNVLSKFGALEDHIVIEANIVLVLKEETFRDDLPKLDHQLSAINLCITAFK